MGWQDRLQEAAYTSPGGARLTFEYEDVQQEFERRVAAFDFPDADGTYVQEVGRSSRRYPLRIILWGDNYDIAAAAFERALAEPGVGRLEHPAYGTVDVIPSGTITRRDDLKSAGNQAVIELTFLETIPLVYPTAQRDPAAAVVAAIDGYSEAAAAGYGDLADLATEFERAAAKNALIDGLKTVQKGLDYVARQQDGVARIFKASTDAINFGIDTLIAEPLDLAFQFTQLIQAPARAAASIGARLSAYGNLLRSTLGGDGADTSRYAESDLLAGAAVSGSVLSVLNGQFETRAGAVEAAQQIIGQFDEYVLWRDANAPGVDTGEAYQQLQEAVALTAGYLVDISFSLKQERRIVLDRARTVIDLSAELYGAVDSRLDFLINSNALSGAEILELPRGRAIVYYV